MSSITPTSSTSQTSSTTTTTGTTSTSSSSSPPITFTGLISGLNTTAIINALMQAYEQPQQDIQNQITQLQTNLNDYQQLSADFTNLQSAADALESPSAWQVMSATTSDSGVATATAGAGASPSTISFNVDQLATANVIASATTVSSLDSTVASGNFLLSSTAAGAGVTSLAGSSLTVGQHSFQVTSALTGGTATGTSPLASSITIGSSNDTITANVNGTAETFTIASGTYTPSQLASAIESASASGGTALLSARVNSRGELEIGTSLLGSGASLQVTGGTALSSLGLATQTSASVGSAGSITLDGTTTSINDVQAGSTTTLSDGSGGSITIGIGGFGIAKESFTATEIAAGNGSLQQVVDNINAAGAGVTASAVQVGSSAYLLQLSSNTTGAAGNITVESGPFSSALGGFSTITQGQDAVVSVGGQGGYTLSSSSNTVQGLLPGVTINLVSAQAAGSSPITLTVSPDGSAMANQVQSLVTAANQALSDINKYAGYNYSTNTGGPLMGDSNLNALTSAILQVVGGALGTGNATAASVGLSLTKNGTINFDSSTFAAAYDANPSQVASLFTQGGTFQAASSSYSGAASLVYAGDQTAAGSYPIVVTQSATQATDAGNVLSSGTITNAENLTVTQGSQSATYDATAGESLSAIAAGLNAAFVSAGLGIDATVASSSSGQQLVLTANAYGSAGDFSVTSSATGSGQTGLATTAGSPSSFSGANVAGTIDGVAATGQGQVLSAPIDNPQLAGLAVQVTASGITSATNIGTFTYQPGIAGSFGFVGNQASAPVTGSLTTTISNLQGQISQLQQQYASYTPMIQSEQQMLQQEFDQMEATLGSLQNEGSYLQAQITKLG